MKKEALLLAIGNSQPFACMQSAKGQVSRVVGNEDRALRLTHSPHRRLEMRLQHASRRNSLAAKKSINSLEFAVVLNHAGEARIGRPHRSFCNALQTAVESNITEVC